MRDTNKKIEEQKLPSNKMIKKIIMVESLLLLGWFLFYYGAWNILDYAGVTASILSNITFIFLGIGLLLFIAIFYRKYNEEE